jgi:UV DNA damage endonuclease
VRLGFAVKVLGPDGRGLKTHDARRPQNGPSLASSLELAAVALDWIVACGIPYWRLSSDLAPFATHPERPQFHDAPARYAAELAAFGQRLRAADVRVTLHPSQYIVLSSPDPGVVDRSVADLEVQAALLDGMSVGPEGVIVLHLGGRYDDPAGTVERLLFAIDALPEAVRRRLVLENDDRVWEAAEVADLCERAGVPMVFDLHHHRCLDRAGARADELLARALATWPAGVPAELHLSSGRDGPTDRRHADGIRDEDWEALVSILPPGADPDVMVEAKAKDHATLHLAHRIATGRLTRPAVLADPLPAWPQDCPCPPPWDAGQPARARL